MRFIKRQECSVCGKEAFHYSKDDAWYLARECYEHGGELLELTYRPWFGINVSNRTPDPEVKEVIDRLWEDFWKDIVAPGGVLDPEQVKIELFDAYQIQQNLSETFNEITGGIISKPMTHANAIIDLVQDHYYGWCVRDVIETLEEELDAPTAQRVIEIIKTQIGDPDADY